MLRYIICALFFLFFVKVSGTPQEIKVVGDYNYPPYSYLDIEGIPAGMDIEILSELEQILDIQFEIHLTEWDSALQSIKDSRAKVITGIIFSEERERQFDFSIPLHTTYYSIFAQKQLKIKDVSDLKGKKIVVLPGDVSINSFIKPMGLYENPSFAKSLPDAITRIESGLYDYVIAPYSLGMEYMNRIDCNNVEVKGPPIMPSMYCLAVKRGNKQLLSQLNKGIERLRSSGKLEQIHHKWIKYQREDQNYLKLIKHALIAVGGLLLLLIIVISWLYTLKKEVGRKVLKIRESEEKFLHIFNSARDALLLIDLNGQIMDVNPEAMKIYGFSYHEMVEKNLLDLINADHCQQIVEFLKNADPSSNFFREFESSNKAQENFHINLKATVFQFRGKKHVLAIIRDITREKLNEMAIRKAKQEAESANQSKSRFISHVSHEVRTPLNAITGFTYLLQEKTTLSSDQEKYVRMIKNSGKTLLEIINEILDISKIESGRIELDEHPFEMSDVIRTIDDMLGIQCAEKGLKLIFQDQTESHLTYLGDSLKLKQILINLCANALKFTETGSITVKISEVSRNDLNKQVDVYFCVADTGIGLRDEEKQKVFTPFDQADASVTRKYGGTGLGLSICQHLTALMGGKIELESEKGKGSQFFYTLTFGYNAHA